MIKRLFRARRILAWSSVICGISVVCYLAMLSLLWETQEKVRRDRERLLQGEVVFPIGHYVVGGKPGPIYKDRLDLTAALWRERARPIWLLAGGRRRMKQSVASVGKRYLVRQGIPPSAVLTVDDLPRFESSLDTTEEIGIASRLAKDKGIDAIVVVAEVRHLAQACLVFESYGVNTLIASTPDAQYGLRYRLTRNGALFITLFDRRGLSLFWLRWIRKSWPNWPWGEF